MKHLKVKKLPLKSVEAEAIPALFDKWDIPFNPISTVNWKDFPYNPTVDFRIAYTDNAVLLHYKVHENTTRAKYGDDGGAVWTDSCVEFFSIPAGDGAYYNLETNCVGTVLLCCGTGRENRKCAPAEVTAQIKRFATLGRKPFDERKVGEWELALVVPFTAFFMHDIKSLEGKTIRANFYKCGDELETPHFLSWNPIGVEKPDFHRPEFFGEVEFEK